jgi:hypothetical protein
MQSKQSGISNSSDAVQGSKASRLASQQLTNMVEQV